MSLEDVEGISLQEYGLEELRIIGRGQYGSVHLVRRTRDKRYYVAKKIALACLSEKERDGAFQEVELLQTLNHPFIVEYEKTLRLQGDILVIVMQYCEGGDISSCIKSMEKSRKHFTEITIMSWFVQLVQALDYMHGERVLHRDLKSSNVFLTNKASIVKVGDFGISRVLEGTMMEAVTVVGTPYYMPPEVCENRPYTFKSDVWALGCVLYELCMLKHAFAASNLLGLVYKIVSEQYDPIPKQYSPELNNLIRKLLTKDAEQRPSIKDLLANPFVARESRRFMREFVATKGGAEALNGQPTTRLAKGKGRGVGGRGTGRGRGKGRGPSSGPGAPPENPQQAMRRRKLEAADKQAERMKEAVRPGGQTSSKAPTRENFRSTAREGTEVKRNIPRPTASTHTGNFAAGGAKGVGDRGASQASGATGPTADLDDEDSFQYYDDDYEEEYEDDFEDEIEEDVDEMTGEGADEIQEEIVADLHVRDEEDVGRVLHTFQEQLTVQAPDLRSFPSRELAPSPPSAPVQRVIGVGATRTSKLRDDCLAGMGADKFNAAFSMLVESRRGAHPDERVIRQQLVSLIGPDLVKRFGFAIDQLVYDKLMAEG
mmetsp:Transcript_134984/g.305533  ORF Transcript_134984/g.305533 Transcript_134984/m.305533 type:complete len:600 (+) Transcript_134984:80-1879(+)